MPYALKEIIVDKKMHAQSGAHSAGFCAVEWNKGKRPIERDRLQGRDAIGANRLKSIQMRCV